MSISRPFILRPIATSLLMVGLLLVGIVAYRQLPISALPQVDYPTIQVVTFYPGASPDVTASSITAPLERQFGELPGLSQMTSSSSFGASVITLQFNLEENIDVAEQEVQAAINSAQTYLPNDLPTPPIYSKVNPADAPILTLAMTSDSMPLPQVEDLADTTFAQKISQLPGVGLVSISGGQKPAVRVMANPTALASYGMSLEQLRSVIAQINVDQAKGQLQDNRLSFTIGANDQLLSPQGYANSIVAYKNGNPVRLSDVATVVMGAENVNQAAWMNTTPAVILNIQRQPGANIIKVVDSIKLRLKQLQANLPASVKVTVLTDRTNTIRASVKDVQFEMMLTIALVVIRHSNEKGLALASPPGAGFVSMVTPRLSSVQAKSLWRGKLWSRVGGTIRSLDAGELDRSDLVWIRSEEGADLSVSSSTNIRIGRGLNEAGILQAGNQPGRSHRVMKLDDQDFDFVQSCIGSRLQRVVLRSLDISDLQMSMDVSGSSARKGRLK